MFNLSNKQLLNLFLVLLLLVAPFEVLFANTHTMNEPDMSISTVLQLEQVEKHSAISRHHHVIDENNSLVNSFDVEAINLNALDFDNAHSISTSSAMNDDCEKKCAHCIFCVAVVFYPFLENTLLPSVYNPHLKVHALGIFPDLHIKPPISI